METASPPDRIETGLRPTPSQVALSSFVDEDASCKGLSASSGHSLSIHRLLTHLKSKSSHRRRVTKGEIQDVGAHAAKKQHSHLC
jgi:hypothetical protein